MKKKRVLVNLGQPVPLSSIGKMRHGYDTTIILSKSVTVYSLVHNTMQPCLDPSKDPSLTQHIEQSGHCSAWKSRDVEVERSSRGLQI